MGAKDGGFRLPTNKQHTLVIGRNGSGKSVAAVWHLSNRDLENETWIVINHKREELINSIPYANFLKMNERPPKGKGRNKRHLQPGVYIYQPRPGTDDDAVTDLLWWVYETEGVGVYIDEGTMINPREKALDALFTQGRSKRTPVIMLSQRPSKITRYAVSEAAFHQVFHLVDARDRKTIQEYIPVDLDEYMVAQDGQDRLLADYHSIYYDVNGDKAVIMRPVPREEELLAVFSEKLAPPNKKFNQL